MELCSLFVPMRSKRTFAHIKTIQDVIDLQLWLRARCVNCGRSTEVPHGMLPDLVPVHLSLSAAAAKFKCGGCGETQAKLSATDPLDNW